MTIRQLLQAILLLAVAITMSRTTADPDLWGHVRFGQDMLAARMVHLSDTYSFTSDQPWINHEWLAEIVMALSFNAFGPSGLNVLRLTITAMVLLLVWWRLTTIGGDRIAVPLTVVAAVGILLRVHPIRPQMFSILFFAVLLTLLTRADDASSKRSLIAVPPLMAVWVNFHGAWIVGLGTLVAWSAGKILSRQPLARERLVTATWTTGAACLATCVNPYGLGLWRFLVGTVGLGRPLIADWQPMFALPPALWSSWIVPFGVAVLAVGRARGQLNSTYGAIVVLLGAGSLRVSRLDAFFALAVVFFLSPMLLPTPALAPPRRPTEGPRKSRALAGIAAASAIAAIVLIVRQLPTIEIPASIMPEPEVVAYVRATHLSGRMLTWFDWGEYAIWHFGPNVKVSMDGRRETVYSETLIEDHLHFYSGLAASLHYPESLRADFVWVPKRLAIVSELRSAGWYAVFDGPTSTILAREGVGTPWIVRSEPTTRLFPGP